MQALDSIFFNSWAGLLRIGLTTVCAYLLIIILLRVSGKRTLAKMNAFDFIVTIALGSILSTLILNKNTPLAEGLLAIGLLIGLQYAFTWLSVRVKHFKKLITNTPTLLFYRGKIFKEVMQANRISQEEVNKSVRAAGYADFHGIEAIVLETTGDLSVISKVEQAQTYSALEDVEQFPHSPKNRPIKALEKIFVGTDVIFKVHCG